MSPGTPLMFGTVEVAVARVSKDGKSLQLNLREGQLNRDELDMLIKFLQAKHDQLDSP